jgi:predicted alpha/beta-fold hydrolase
MTGSRFDAFEPQPRAIGGHRQTLLGYWHRRFLTWPLPAQNVVVDAERGVRLLLRATLQPSAGSRPTLLLVHGLGSCDRATYATATGLLAWSRGWNVVRMNMRGAGDSLGLCARLYNAGMAGDFVAALDRVATISSRVGVIGFSLGGNLALLALARRAERITSRLIGAVAVSPPLSLAACAWALEQPANRVYQEYIMRSMRASYRSRQRLLPDLYARGRERGKRTIRQFDEAITAPYGGFRDADDYYARCSSGPDLHRIEHRVLLVAAQDDPLIPGDSVACWPLPQSGNVRREMLATGGHVGFVAPTIAPGRFWAAERALRFLDPQGE